MSITVHADSLNGQWTSFTSGTSTITVTCVTGELVVAHINLNGNAAGAEVISAIQQLAGQPAWTKRKQDNHHDAGGGREQNYSQEVWYFVATGNSTSATATVTASGGSSPTGCWSIHRFANVNTTTPWDANAAVPTTSNITVQTDTSATYSSLTTTGTLGMILHFATFNPRSGDTHTLSTPGAGHTTLGAGNNSGSGTGLTGFTASQYKAYSSAQSNATGVMANTSTFIVSWADAIQEAAAADTTSIAMTLSAPTMALTANALRSDIAMTLPALTLALTMGNSSLDAETIAMTMPGIIHNALGQTAPPGTQPNDMEPQIADAGAGYWWVW